jgi:hypothetical protein
MMLNMEIVMRIKMFKGGVASNGMMFKQCFMKIHPLISKFLGCGERLDRQTDIHT